MSYTISDQTVGELSGEITLQDLHYVVEMLLQRYSKRTPVELFNAGGFKQEFLRVVPVGAALYRPGASPAPEALAVDSPSG